MGFFLPFCFVFFQINSCGSYGLIFPWVTFMMSLAPPSGENFSEDLSKLQVFIDFFPHLRPRCLAGVDRRLAWDLLFLLVRSELWDLLCGANHATAGQESRARCTRVAEPVTNIHHAL